MGQKVNPVGFRLVVDSDKYLSHFGPTEAYSSVLHEDFRIREYIYGILYNSKFLIGNIVISRSFGRISVEVEVLPKAVNGVNVSFDWNIYSNQIITFIEKSTQSSSTVLFKEVCSPFFSATLLAKYVAGQIEERVSFKLIVKEITKNLRIIDNVQGVKLSCSGRIRGEEMARTVWVKEGRVSLQSIRENVDYSDITAHTAYGSCGIKVWICYK